MYVIFIAAATNDFANSPQAVLIFFLVTIGFLLKTAGVTWTKDRAGGWLAGGFILVWVWHLVSNGVFTVGAIKFYVVVIALYHMVKQHGRTYTDTLFKDLYALTLITIPFYIVHVISEQTLKAVLSPFNMSYHVQAIEGGVYVFFYNMNPWLADVYANGVVRNSGFMWEPGAFGAMIVLQLAYRYVVVNAMTFSREMKILIVYSITTISTTTLFALFTLMTLVYYKKYKRQSVKLISVLGIGVVIAIPVYNLPFMKGKIDEYLEKNVDYKSIYERRLEIGEKKSIGRFAGMLIELDRLKHRPILGYGWDEDYEMLGLGNLWSNPNGLAVLMGKFGLVGMLFLGFCLSGFIPFEYNVSVVERLLISLLILLPVFSNPLQSNIVFWCLLLMGFINAMGKSRKSKTAPSNFVRNG